MTADFAPDLLNGYMISGYDSSNRWQTSIESVLRRTRPGAPIEQAFLAHECRGESISDVIFDGRLYEFFVVSAWSGTTILRHGVSQYPLNPLRCKDPYRDFAVERTSLNSRVFCDEAPIRFLSTEEAVSFLRDETPGKGNRIFLEVVWNVGNIEYQLYAPCRYTNFPHPDSERMYVQPISGPVLYEDNDLFYTAYVAFNLDQSEVRAAEFILRNTTGFFALRGKGLFGRALGFLDRLFRGRLLVIDEYWQRKRLEGARARLFLYEEKGQ